MRIIRGKYKTRRYPVPKSFPSRPTTDFAKEGLFNVLEHQFLKDSMKILDLCTGTGNLAIEFLSREWGHVTAVDRNYNCIKHLKSMAARFDCGAALNIVKSDILKFVRSTHESYDMIVADPPYDYKEYEILIQTIFERELLHEDGVLVIEHGKHTSLESITHFKFLRIYGGVCFSFFEKAES